MPLFKEAVELRDEAARLLGYPNHAALRIEDKMAKNTTTVNDFLSDLRTRLTPGGKEEIARLLALKKKDTAARGLDFDGGYYFWDNRFYDRLMIEQDYSIDENKIAEFFPLQSTVTGMLKIFEELLGFVFVELGPEERAKISSTGKAEDISWHEDVILFSVWDDASEGDGFVGYLYLDLHPRKGKYGHAANFNLQPGFIQKDGSRRYPATALVCNFSKPTANKPSLLKHDEVVTLFHELGHGIHDLAGRTRFARFHGTSTVRDFVEAPSQMLENWCWTPSVLRSLSNQYQTGEKIPDDLIEKLIATKHVNGALFNLRQLHFGIFDMTIHAPKSREELQAMNLPKIYNGLRADICGIQGPEAIGYELYVSGPNPLSLRGYFHEVDCANGGLRVVTGATASPRSATSWADTTLVTTATCSRTCTRRTCSIRSSRRTRWTGRRGGGTGIRCWRRAAARTRWSRWSSSWGGSPARRRSTGSLGSRSRRAISGFILSLRGLGQRAWIVDHVYYARRTNGGRVRLPWLPFSG